MTTSRLEESLASGETRPLGRLFMRRIFPSLHRGLNNTCAWVLTTILLFLLLAAPVRAYSDKASGFGLVAPQGFVAEQTSRRQFDVGVGIRGQDGIPPAAGTSPYPCEAGFKFSTANNGLSKAEINKAIQSPEWRNVARSTVGMIFVIEGERTVSAQGYRGLEMTVSPKVGPGSGDVRGLMTIVETAKGRMTIVCMTTKSAFTKATPLFRSLPRRARLPE